MNTIEQNNALIAEFMGFKVEFLDDKKTYRGWGMYPYDSKIHVRNLTNSEEDSWKSLLSPVKYNESWSWLMPVVEKIESIYLKPHGYFGVYISSNSCTIQGTKFNTLKPELNVYFKEYHEETKLKSTYEAVVNFIKWHQEQTK